MLEAVPFSDNWVSRWECGKLKLDFDASLATELEKDKMADAVRRCQD